MRLAVPIWNGNISPVLDTASRMLILEVGVLKHPSRFEIYLPREDLAARCALMRNLAVDVILCGAVSRRFSEMLRASGVRMVSGTTGPAETVVAAYMEGTLTKTDFFLPGWREER